MAAGSHRCHDGYLHAALQRLFAALLRYQCRPWFPSLHGTFDFSNGLRGRWNRSPCHKPGVPSGRK